MRGAYLVFHLCPNPSIPFLTIFLSVLLLLFLSFAIFLSPYICYLIFAGALLIQFYMNTFSFLQKRRCKVFPGMLGLLEGSHIFKEMKGEEEPELLSEARWHCTFFSHDSLFNLFCSSSTSSPSLISFFHHWPSPFTY